MGFITLSTNESTGFKSRELQSVNVGPHRGTHLKLRLGAAHANRHNSFHQVALIAVNVLGTDLSADGTDEFAEQLAASATDVAPLSVCDDLSFSMYVDESVAEVVREMESKKTAAVNGECEATVRRYDQFSFNVLPISVKVFVLFICVDIKQHV